MSELVLVVQCRCGKWSGKMFRGEYGRFKCKYCGKGSRLSSMQLNMRGPFSPEKAEHLIKQLNAAGGRA